MDGVEPQQGDGEKQPSLHGDDGREVAVTFGDGKVDQRYDIYQNQSEYHDKAMLSCSR